MKSIRLLHLLKNTTKLVVLSVVAIPGIVLAEGDCRNLVTYIATAEKNASYIMEVSRFTTERPDGSTFNSAVEEIVKYTKKLNSEVGDKRIACAVIASSRAKKVLAYAIAENYNVKYASAMQQNLDEVKGCLVIQHPTLETAEQIYNYESAAYYTCNGK